MGAVICKQPNGLYCRFSSIVDCPTHWNMTADKYIEMKMKEAKKEAIDVLLNHLYPFNVVLERYVPNNNMADEEWKEFLKDVGYLGEDNE